MYPYNFQPQRSFVDMRKIFIAMPFDKQYQGIYTDLIIPAIEKVNSELDENEKLEWYIGKDPKHTRSGWLEILENLYTARIVIGVLTGDNPNVFYELGISHATQQIERQLLIAEKNYNPKFDLKDLIYIKYDPENLSGSVDDLSEALKDTLKVYKTTEDRLASIAESRLSLVEFHVLMNYYHKSHFVFTADLDQWRLDGLAYLCHAGLLRLSKKVRKGGKDKNIEYSYYWTDLGNIVLNRFARITKDEMNQRINEYQKHFKV